MERDIIEIEANGPLGRALHHELQDDFRNEVEVSVCLRESEELLAQFVVRFLAGLSAEYAKRLIDYLVAKKKTPKFGKLEITVVCENKSFVIPDDADAAKEEVKRISGDDIDARLPDSPFSRRL